MPRRELKVVVAVAQAAIPLEAGDSASVPAEVGFGVSGGSRDLLLPLQPSGDGGCGGAGGCPT